MIAFKKIGTLSLALMMALCWSGLSLAADAKDAKKEEVKAETKATADTSKKQEVQKSTKPEPKQKADKKKTTKKKAAKKKAPSKPVNINTASEKELQQLAGVGPKTAKAIVEYRKKNGNFKTAEDLMKVKGVGKKTFGKNKAFIKVK